MSSVTPQGLAGSPQQPARFVGWAFLSRACPLGPTIHPPDLPAESSKHHTGRHYEPAHVCSAGTAQYKQIFPWPGPLSPVTTPCSSHCSGEHAASLLETLWLGALFRCGYLLTTSVEYRSRTRALWLFFSLRPMHGALVISACTASARSACPAPWNAPGGGKAACWGLWCSHPAFCISGGEAVGNGAHVPLSRVHSSALPAPHQQPLCGKNESLHCQGA